MYYGNQMKAGNFYGQPPGFSMIYPPTQPPQEQCPSSAENRYPQSGQNLQGYYNDPYYSQQYSQNFPASSIGNKMSAHMPQNSAYVKPTGKSLI